jgi:N4-gp56 family major capsid protein
MATGATTTFSPSLAADVTRYLAEDLLDLTIDELVLYNFAEKLVLPKGQGTTYTMTRVAKLPLAYTATAEGVPPVATPLQISQATVQLQQFTALVTITDVVSMTIKHDMFKIAKDRLALAASELMERNTIQAVLAFPQINYVNSKGARASLATTDVMNTSELQRAFAFLQTLGVPMFKGPKGPKVVKSAAEGQPNALRDPRSGPHYVGVFHPLVQADLRKDPQVQLVSAYSSPNRLYNYEFGEWNSIRFVSSNFLPAWTGVAALTLNSAAGYLGSNAGGSLASGNYQVIITASDQIFQNEAYVWVQSGNITGVSAGSSGSISVALPSTYTGYTFSVYLSAPGSTSVINLGLCAAGPTTGLLQGQATQLAGGQTVVITGIGVAKVPPAPPAAGITVYPTFLFGDGAYAIVTLQDIETNYLDSAEKTDPANQLKMASFKYYNGCFIKNAAFAMRIESSSQYSLTNG